MAGYVWKNFMFFVHPRKVIPIKSSDSCFDHYLDSEFDQNITKIQIKIPRLNKAAPTLRPNIMSPKLKGCCDCIFFHSTNEKKEKKVETSKLNSSHQFICKCRDNLIRKEN
jgi:hypothetical protein